MSLNNNIIGKQELLMNSLTKFFTHENNMSHLLPIVDGTSKISLRIIDWFVTNYAKKNNTSYPIREKNDNSQKKQFIVHLSYKSQLKAYSKKQFDPFCRRERISFQYNNIDELTTTVGQLNFFRWAIENKVLDYIHKNLNDIEKDMTESVRPLYSKRNISGKKSTAKKGGNTVKVRRKRQELSVSATRSVSKHDVAVTVDFH